MHIYKLRPIVTGYILTFIMASVQVNGSGLKFNIDYPGQDNNGLKVDSPIHLLDCHCKVSVETVATGTVLASS